MGASQELTSPSPSLEISGEDASLPGVALPPCSHWACEAAAGGGGSRPSRSLCASRTPEPRCAKTCKGHLRCPSRDMWGRGWKLSQTRLRKGRRAGPAHGVPASVLQAESKASEPAQRAASRGVCSARRVGGLPSIHPGPLGRGQGTSDFRGQATLVGSRSPDAGD